MNRREFLKSAAVFLLSLTIHSDGLSKAKETDDEPVIAVGPKLKDGLVLKEGDRNAFAQWEGETVLTTNKEGLQLLKLADGTRSLECLIGSSHADPEAVINFYLELGRNGWLENRLEVSQYVVEI